MGKIMVHHRSNLGLILMLCLSWFGVFIEEEQHGQSHEGRETEENGNNLCIEGSRPTWRYAASRQRQSRTRQRNCKDKQHN